MIVASQPFTQEPPDCAALDFTCQTTNAVGGWIAGGARGMMNWAAGGLSYAVSGADVTDGQLQALERFASSLFGGIGVFIVLLCLIIAVTSTAVRLRGMGILYAVGRAVLAVFLLSAVVWLLTNPTWSIIKLGDEVSAGLIQGLGLSRDGLSNQFQAMFGLTEDSLSWSTDPNVSFGSGQEQAQAGADSIGDASLRLGQWALLAAMCAVVWVLTMILQVMLSLRLMTLLVLGGVVGLAVAFLPLGKGGPAVLKKFGLAWFALWAAKPVVAIVLGIGVKMLESTATGFNIPQMISAMVVILMASVAPLASMRFFGWLDAAAAQMADGGERVGVEKGAQAVKVTGAIGRMAGTVAKPVGTLAAKGAGGVRNVVAAGVTKARAAGASESAGTASGSTGGPTSKPGAGKQGAAGATTSGATTTGASATGSTGAASATSGTSGGGVAGGRHSGGPAPRPAVSGTGSGSKKPPAPGGMKPPAGGGSVGVK